LYQGEGAGKTLVGFYTDEAAAAQAAASWTTTQNGGAATLETVYNNSRVGTDYFANFSTDQARWWK
jgi:anionic cell wall polymer biosynthesis LytR-Cps2A-Psr (LCP) family protein